MTTCTAGPASARAKARVHGRAEGTLGTSKLDGKPRR
jgi:hypothetical protein